VRLLGALVALPLVALGGCAGDDVGGVEMRIAGEVVAVPDQEVAGRLVAAVAQMKHHVLGQRTDAVSVGARLDEVLHGTDLVVGQPLATLDLDAHARPIGHSSRP